MLRGAPENSLGLAHSSGWMTKENFVKVLRHFINHSGASIENQCLLLLDNHQSHVNLDVIKLAKENGVHLLTFPPHCSHRLQPLDVGVYGPFKNYYNTAAAAWMTSNPGKTISIYTVPELVKSSFNRSMTRNNILSSFEKSGIHPLNPEIFSEDDFLTSHVTDRPTPEVAPLATPECSQALAVELEKTPELINVPPESKTPSPNAHLYQKKSAKKVIILSDIKITPEFVRPYPKAEPRLKKRQIRRPGRTRVLTDTPEKEEIENYENERAEKVNKQGVKRKVALEKKNKQGTKI